MRRLSRGAERLLDRLLWYAARFRRVYPSQAKLAAGLDVCAATVRRWLLELKRAGLVLVHKCGPNSAEYELKQDAIDQLHAEENARSTRGMCAVNARSGPYCSSVSSSYVARAAKKPPRRATAQDEMWERLRRKYEAEDAAEEALRARAVGA